MVMLGGTLPADRSLLSSSLTRQWRPSIQRPGQQRRETRVRSNDHSKIDPLTFHHQKPFLDIGVNRTDIFAQNTQEKQLHRREEEDSYD